MILLHLLFVDTVDGLRYSIIHMNSLSDFTGADSPVAKSLDELRSGGGFEGKVDLHVMDPPYGLGGAGWDKEAWTATEFTAVLKVCCFKHPKPFRMSSLTSIT